MPLNKGTKNIIAIYKGLKSQSAIYKGTKLVYSSAFWQSLFYSYLYHDLIPTTINNKNVLDLAKVSKIYANGVVENQQIIPTAIPATSTSNGITLTNNGDGSYTMSGTATAMATFVAYSAATLNKGHKYLEYFVPRGGSPETYLGGDANGFLDPADHGGTIANTTFSTNTAALAYYLRVMSGTTVNITWKPMLFDLTLMFGAGNEPTAITDKRIQAILNRGYIPYNTGEYKGTNIGVFSSEPYNLFNLDRQIGNTTGWDWDTTNSRNFEEDKFYVGITSNNYFIPTTISSYSVTNNSVTINHTAGGYGIGFPVRVMPNQRYTIEYQTDDVSQPNTNMGWFDKNGKLISFDNDLINKLSPANAYWGLVVLNPSSTNRNVTFTNICLHRTGTRTGYAPYVESTLPAIYQSTYKQIEFIQNNGTQYLNLGFVPNTNEKWAFELDYTDVSANGSNYVMGSRSGSSTIYFGVTGASATKAITVANTTLTLADNYRVANTEYLVKASYTGTTGGTCSLLNKRTNVLTSGTQNVSLTGSSANVYLFALNSSNIHSGMKVHYLKVWKADTLYLDLVPVKRISDGVVGLLDKLNNVFYTNAGSGTFIAGKEIQVYNELPFIYQGNGALNAKDTYELTKDNHIFTKNIGVIDLWTLNGYVSNSRFIVDSSSSPFNLSQASSNDSGFSCCCSKYLRAKGYEVYDKTSDKIMCLTSPYIGNNFAIYDSAFNNLSVSQIQQLLSGVLLYYELATPQVITIPKKHLGRYTFNGSEYASVINTNSQGIVTVLINLTYYSGVSGASNNNNYLVGLSTKTYQSATYDESNSLYYDGTYLIINVGKTTDADTLQELVGKTLFYETNTEVSDIADSLFIQGGGSISAYESRLPFEYQEVEYIQSDGNQYINLQFAPTVNTKTELDFQVTSVQAGSTPIFGYRNGDDKYAIWIANGTLQFAFNLGTQDTGYSFSQSMSSRAKLTMSSAGYYYNDTFLDACSNTRTISCGNAYLFALNGGGWADNRIAVMKVYGCKVYESGVLIRDYVPCYRKSDNVIGLFDRVNKTFYVNSGSGSFTKGNVVSKTWVDCQVLPDVEFSVKCK